MSRADNIAVLREEWCAILGVEAAAPEQNFFALGGDSLAAVDLIARVAERTQWEIPVEAIFLDGTLEGLERSLHHAPVER